MMPRAVTPERNPSSGSVENTLRTAAKETNRTEIVTVCIDLRRVRRVMRGPLVVTRRKESPLNTQSSATVALRALVMLVCLVVVPLAAIFGTSVPDWIRQPFERYLGINAASASTSLSEAPRSCPMRRLRNRRSLPPMLPRPQCQWLLRWPRLRHRLRRFWLTH